MVFEQDQDGSYLGIIAEEVKPLHNALIMLQIGKYLQSQDFWQLCESNDLKEMYEAASSYVIGEDMLSYETISEAEKTLGILLSHLYHDSEARFFARLEIILTGFRQWRFESTDYFKLAGPLLQLGFSRDDISRTLDIDERDLPKEALAEDLWSITHPSIFEVARPRFKSSHYADAVEAALKEVNVAVKEIVKKKTGQELDGATLMQIAFSPNKPVIVLDDLSTESGQNIQKGYMQIFAGAMTGIRNPKAHENVSITKENAMHFIILASLLMFMVDQSRRRPRRTGAKHRA